MRLQSICCCPATSTCRYGSTFEPIRIVPYYATLDSDLTTSTNFTASKRALLIRIVDALVVWYAKVLSLQRLSRCSAPCSALHGTNERRCDGLTAMLCSVLALHRACLSEWSTGPAAGLCAAYDMSPTCGSSTLQLAIPAAHLAEDRVRAMAEYSRVYPNGSILAAGIQLFGGSHSHVRCRRRRGQRRCSAVRVGCELHTRSAAWDTVPHGMPCRMGYRAASTRTAPVA